MTTTNTATLSTLRADYRTARSEMDYTRTTQDLRDLLAIGAAHGGRPFRVARMVERMLRRERLAAAAVTH